MQTALRVRRTIPTSSPPLQQFDACRECTRTRRQITNRQDLSSVSSHLLCPPYSSEKAGVAGKKGESEHVHHEKERFGQLYSLECGYRNHLTLFASDFSRFAQKYGMVLDFLRFLWYTTQKYGIVLDKSVIVW
jgi:hypothetical protein